MNILFQLEIYIEIGHTFHYDFLCTVSFSKKKYIRVKKRKEIYDRNIFQIFVNRSHLTNIIPIAIPKFWDSQTIPIPNRTEFGSANLFLFLFAGRITIR